MRLGIKGKQVTGVTSIVGLSIVAVSVLHLASLARVAVEESKARGELLTNAIFHRARVAISQQADPYLALRRRRPTLDSRIEHLFAERDLRRHRGSVGQDRGA